MPINRPNVYELIESVREMMEMQLLPALEDKSLVYQSRVAVNILKIVERELQQINSLNQTEAESLRNLLGTDADVECDISALNNELVAKIEQGEFDKDSSKLLAHFQLVVLGKIAIDNPGYSSYKYYLESGELPDH